MRKEYTFDLTLKEAENLYLQLWDLAREHPGSDTDELACKVCSQFERQGVNPLEYPVT